MASNSLYSKLDLDFSIRRKELHILKSNIAQNDLNMRSALLRSFIPLLYAHFEGFIKISASSYLKHINLLRLKNSELNDTFLAYSMNTTSRLSELDRVTKVINFLRTKHNNRARLSVKKIIDTKSNLNAAIFESICVRVGFDWSYYKHKSEIIDSLVNLRNKIGHGEHNLPDFETVTIYHDEIIVIMGMFKTEIENSCALESYKINNH